MADEPLFDRGRDRKKHLRVQIDAVVLVEREGGLAEVSCRELSVGGARFLVAEPVGAHLELQALRLGEESYELGVIAEVVAEADGGIDVEFIDLDPITRSNVQAAFSAAVAPMLAERRASAMDMRFHWAFRDAVQLSEAIRVLLSMVELHDLWSADGPSQAIEALAGGADLPPMQQAMLRIAATLWSGSLEVSAENAILPEQARASIEALLKAAARGPTGIDEWLQVEGR